VSGLQELGSGNPKSLHGLSWQNISTENKTVSPGKYHKWQNISTENETVSPGKYHN